MARRQIRYAVVGLGHIAQMAVLPAFANARRNSVLSALVSGDRGEAARARRAIRRRSRPGPTSSTTSACRAAIDAVYIALPNHLHCEYAVRAARAGVHVLCEKPLALTEEECEAMIGGGARGRRQADDRLPPALRARQPRSGRGGASGRLGEPRLFNSTFCMQVEPGNIRLRRETGGGALWDIGIYCINAARYLFRDEPVEVQAQPSSDGRFGEVEEIGQRGAAFPGRAPGHLHLQLRRRRRCRRYRIVGTEGRPRGRAGVRIRGGAAPPR